MSITTTKFTIIKMFIIFFGLFFIITFSGPQTTYAAQTKTMFNGQTITNGEYVIKNSDTKLIKPATLKKLTSDQLRIARNEIYARHGRRFHDEGLQNYFNARSWYRGTIDPDCFDEAVFSEIEQKNIARICKAEAERASTSDKPTGSASDLKDGFYSADVNYKSNFDVSDCGSVDYWELNDHVFTLKGTFIYLDSTERNCQPYTRAFHDTTMNFVIAENASYFTGIAGSVGSCKKNYFSSEEFWNRMYTYYKPGDDSFYLDLEVRGGVVVALGMYL